ncbi:hypothetical protein ACFWGP_00705 [Agromyces sp. NPDC127015]|uniref:hypothetical protein n=1 Tax=Agromyces sp. NPDC127015 TaxID=3347108 RepID=UPI00364E5F80
MTRRWVPPVAGAALVAAAWGVTAVTPAEDSAEQPFVVAAPVGMRAEGRNLALTVTGVRAADAVVNGGWRAEGEWVVVDVESEATRMETGTLLQFVTLRLGGRTYRASERPPDSMFGHPLSVGLPSAGSVAFELPEGALDAGAAGVPDELVLRFGLNLDDRLDSVLETRVPLDDLEHVGEAEIAPVDWAGS